MNRIWIASAIIALSSSLPADSIVSSTGTLSAFPSGFASTTAAWGGYAAPPPNPASAFWNNPSADTGTGGSHMMNIGYLLTDGGGFTGTVPVLTTETVTDDLTASNGSSPEFNFLRSSTVYNLALLFADSSLNTGNPSQGTVFGYYVGDTFTPLFAPQNTSAPTADTPFDPTAAGNSYGFYATVCYAVNLCETYTTGEGNFGNVSSAAGWDHFTVFQLSSGNYVIGLEDSMNLNGEGVGDYNDVVIELKDPVSAPEPGTFTSLGIGVVLMLVGSLSYFGRKIKRD